jgi:hypothetical protein
LQCAASMRESDPVLRCGSTANVVIHWRCVDCLIVDFATRPTAGESQHQWPSKLIVGMVLVLCLLMWENYSLPMWSSEIWNGIACNAINMNQPLINGEES